MNETAVLNGPKFKTTTNTKPILVKVSDSAEQGISHIHLPGENDYEQVLKSIREIARNLGLSFDDSAKHLGYELGFAVEHFTV